MWECPHCGAVFSTASSWSIDEDDGVLCPECNEFISDEELEESADAD